MQLKIMLAAEPLQCKDKENMKSPRDEASNRGEYTSANVADCELVKFHFFS